MIVIAPACLSPRRPGFAPGSIHVGFVMYSAKWHWDRFFSEFFGFPLSIYHSTVTLPGPKADMPLLGHPDANRHALLNTRKLPVYSTCRLCQQTQTLNLLVVVQEQCTMGCAADESGMEGGFSAP
jgi:hypothetical protein